MTASIQPSAEPVITYPDSDGQPVADNTKQLRCITTIQGGLDALFKNNTDVFVAGDLLWYPVEGDNKTRLAPDILVVFGRPKGDRGSYQQWREDNIPPHVVFEVLSPGNRVGEMLKKLRFYEDYGVEEYYMCVPDHVDLTGWLRGNKLNDIVSIAGWVSPLLGIRFELGSELEIYRPDGQKFLTYVELERERELAQSKVERLAERLRSMGVNPDEV